MKLITVFRRVKENSPYEEVTCTGRWAIQEHIAENIEESILFIEVKMPSKFLWIDTTKTEFVSERHLLCKITHPTIN